MRVITTILIALAFLPSPVRASEFNRHTIKIIIERFAVLDDACRQLTNSGEAQEREAIGTFRSELYITIATFSGIKTTPNPEFADPLRDYSKVLSDTMKQISQNQPTDTQGKQYGRPPGQLMAIPMITMGVASALMSGAEKGLDLSQAEQEDVMSEIQKKFGGRVPVKEDDFTETPFAVSVSLIHGLITHAK